MKDYPSVTKQISNLTETAFSILKTYVTEGSIRTTKEIENCRWQICKTCKLYDPEQHRCRECGCYIQNKLECSGSHCPLNFW